MSFWDNVKKFAQPYSDDEYDDYDEDEEYDDGYEEPERPVRSSRSATRRPAPAPVSDEEEDEGDTSDDFGFSSPVTANSGSLSSGGFTGQVLNMSSSSANKQEVVLFRPSQFNDSSKAADDLRNHKAVIVNLESVDKAMARRVVDFLSGCVYALNGDVKKVAQSAYLFCPHNMGIIGDLETIQAEVENYI